MKTLISGLAAGLLLLLPTLADATQKKEKPSAALKAETFTGLKLRGIGPAMMSGRIADIAIDPNDPATWYVGVASGGVWKTTNAGTTWKSVFDGQKTVFSVGDVTLDPSNANIVWVGTGENVGGRHLSWGDGIYKSEDGGKTFKNMGLAGSEHLSDIVVHPENGDVVWVASQGPLWSKGGERGVFKTQDGGKTWRNVLKTSGFTGVTSLVSDPRDPDRLYAATWQHHRTVAAYMGGGPETALYRSEDGGETWDKLTTGLPKGTMGKIGLAVSPINPDVVYAAIETENRKGGIWRSSDRGASWKKMSDMVAGGTGPHYYQELYASPHKFDRLYLMNNYSQVSEDGGKTWRRLKLKYKHVDDHAMAFHPTDPDYLLFGSDGGLYESYDLEENWRFINNLPVTQFYKVAVDDAMPYYNVFGGTQDNSTQGGPSRTTNRHGIRNDDWVITIFADGHQPATEPGNPDIVYSSWQQGNLVRVDRKTDEVVHIQPQPAPGDPAERFNWDAPIYVSRHDPKRIYHASQRLWRSDDRGDSWTALSGDLTRNEDRMKLPIMGRQWSFEAGWDLLAMSNYNSITSVGESPVDEDILYVGTDDGLIQVTNDGGASWKRIEVSKLPGVPERAFVNDIRADLYDADTVYVALDNHKEGDYAPYLYKSTNQGKSWKRMMGDLPEKTLVWRIVQDHKEPGLFFLGTEFGLYFTVDAGAHWIQLKGGAPTISFRDVTIQRREDDVVGATFGRGFYILDDLAPLRDVAGSALDSEALLWGGRRAYWYVEKHPLGFSKGASQGSAYYRAENPPFGAVFTYYLKEGLKSQKDIRVAAEKPLIKDGKDTPFPGFDVVEEERREIKPEIWLTVKDADGTVIRRLPGKTSKGFHRVAWDLRVASPTVAQGAEKEPASGWLVVPGDYSVTLSSRVRGVDTVLAGPEKVSVVPLPGNDKAIEGATPEAAVEFWARLGTLRRDVSAASASIESMDKMMTAMKAAIARTPSAPGTLDTAWRDARRELYALEELLSGNPSQDGYGAEPASVTSQLAKVSIGTGLSTYGPTDTHEKVIGYAETAFDAVKGRLNILMTETLPALEKAIVDAGGPRIPGRPID